MEWKLTDAENKFGEVFSRAMAEGPQRIHRRDGTAILISEKELDALRRTTNPMIAYLMSGPGLEDVDLTRDNSPMREVEL